MKTIKSLILGSAAGLLAMGGAQAADLPVKAKAVEYVKICSLYGAGFFYIPGTDTCIKLGGYLRADVTFNGGVYGAPFWNGDGGQTNRYRDYFGARSRMQLTVDTRTATQYGVVRTFGLSNWQFQNNGTANATTLGTFPASSTTGLMGPGGGYVSVDLLFIQFAGFTFGRSASAYSTPWHGYPGNNTSFLMGGNDSVTGVNNIQYQAQFGNGVSATIGLEDPSVYDRTAVLNMAFVPTVASNAAGVGAYGGTHAPDIVGNVRVDQAWGLFQISGRAHEVVPSYNILTAGTGVPNNVSEISGHPDSKWGGSVMAALQIKNIPTGAGDDIKIDASYTKGAVKDVIATSAPSPSFVMFGGTGLAGAYQSIGFGQTADATYLPVFAGGDGQLKLVDAWGVRGAFNHNWDPQWSTSLWGAYSAVRYSGTVGDLTTAKGQWCANYTTAAKAPSADYVCNPDFNVAQVGMVTRWTPVANLTFSGEVGAIFLDQKMTGSMLLTPTAPKPVARYEFRDQSTVYLNFQARRNF
ncbi:porin [Bradyrhizobium sp.]|uniref:porin n=1 Tax=Bradyrhizobium sp. TaxID=376 RepID=UPI001D39591B|nr:porin [Bradyrhizobium sp.]MBI5319991.1 porin [Bradyrhizobium sp.]